MGLKTRFHPSLHKKALIIYLSFPFPAFILKKKRNGKQFIAHIYLYVFPQFFVLFFTVTTEIDFRFCIFQVIPLVVIVGGACTAGIGFTIRQAVKNPDVR